MTYYIIFQILTLKENLCGRFEICRVCHEFGTNIFDKIFKMKFLVPIDTSLRLFIKNIFTFWIWAIKQPVMIITSRFHKHTTKIAISPKREPISKISLALLVSLSKYFFVVVVPSIWWIIEAMKTTKKNEKFSQVRLFN